MWVLYTCIAAILWGLSYTISEILLKNYAIPYYVIGLVTSLFSVILWFMICLANPTDWSIKRETISLLVLDSLIIVLAAGLTYYSINQKNSAIVSFIEISYPVFTLLFSYLLISQFSISFYQILGGIFMMIGCGFILIG